MTPASPHILVVDDQPPNVDLLVRLLARWDYDRVVSTTDSTQVLPMCEAEPPDLILLDLMMPDPDGFEIMRRLEPLTRGEVRLPIIVLTADVTPEAKRRALAAGARDFLTKPFDPVEVRLRVASVLETRALQLALQDQNAVLEERVRERTLDVERSRRETLERLVLAGEYRDDDTNQHAQRVGRTVGRLAEQLGVDAHERALLRAAAPLHDIGKIGIPDAVLLKPARLTSDEFELMKTHTLIGEQMLAGSTSDVLRMSAVIAISHHERWEGGGYPDGIAGAEIPLAGRLTAVADVFDALTHARPYKAAWPVEDAVAEILRQSGAQFDPDVVAAFRSLDAASLLEPVERAA